MESKNVCCHNRVCKGKVECTGKMIQDALSKKNKGFECFEQNKDVRIVYQCMSSITGIDIFHIIFLELDT